jgi:regulator of RNase E activity RraA
MIALERGIAGAVINGACRDAAEIAGLGFPVWSVAVCPRRSRNEFGLAGLDRDLDIRGVRIRSGDLIVADDSGVVCVPADLAEKVVRRCAEILASETKVVAAVKARLQVDWNAV